MKREGLKKLVSLLGRERVLSRFEELNLYKYDGCTEGAPPVAVVFPESTEEVVAVVRTAAELGVPVIPRGAGTNLSGGSVPCGREVVLALTRMKRIEEIRSDDQVAVVEPGVVNMVLQEAAGEYGFFYAPDPASQTVSTIGGNAAENAGGPHCIKYGVTADHVMGLEVVTAEGKAFRTGGCALDPPGYDLVGLMVGSEGTLGVVTRVFCRLLRLPPHVATLLVVFDSLEEAGEAVSEVIARGIIPAALEMMDKTTMEAVNESVGAGYPADAEAVLIVDVDGLEEDVAAEAGEVERICRAAGARRVEVATEAGRRISLWAGRKGAFGAIARRSPHYTVCDGTVPRNKLAGVLREVAAIGKRNDVSIANVFHAGDGNLHPLILFDPRDEGAKERAGAAFREILDSCIKAGGTISGEHGIGIEKREAMRMLFSNAEVEFMRRLKQQFDPGELLNPGKVLPELREGEDGSGKRRATREPLRGDGCSVRERAAVEAPHVDLSSAWEAFPEDEEELSGVLRWATAASARVLLLGGATKLGQAPRARPDLVIRLAHLSGISDYDRDNLTVTVRAGTTVNELSEFVSAEGRFLPLDPIGGGRGTLGGTVAVNAWGPRRLACGGVRELLLSARMILPDGTQIKAGRGTMKDVAGYDLKKLVVGSYGTLAAITEVTLRLYPKPGKEFSIMCGFDEPGEAHAFARKLLGSGAKLTGLVVATGLEPSGVPRGASWTLLARVECGRAGSNLKAPAWKLMMSEYGKRYTQLAEEDAGALWMQIRDAPKDAEAGTIAATASVPLGKELSAVEVLGRVCGRTGEKWKMQLYPGLGKLLVWGSCDGSESAAGGLLRDMRSGAEGLGGWLSVIRAPGGAAPDVGSPPPAEALQEKVKMAFDPDGILPRLAGEKQ